jgi:hypothetical protein
MVRTHIVLPQGIRKTENIWLYVYHREVLVSEKVIKVFWDTESMSAATRQIDFEDGANFTLKKGPARRFRCLRVIPRICPKFYNGSVVPNYYDNQGTLRWTEATERAFQDVKVLFEAWLILYKLNLKWRFVLQTDTCTASMRVVLYQKGDQGDRRVFSYVSVKFLPSE